MAKEILHHSIVIAVAPVAHTLLDAFVLQHLDILFVTVMPTLVGVKRQLNSKLEVDGILLTMVDHRTVFSREMCQKVRQTYGTGVLMQEIPRSVRAAEISAAGKSIFEYDPNGKVAAAYENLTKEVLGYGKSVRRNQSHQVR